MFSAAIKSGAAGNPTDPQFKYVTMLLHGDGTNGAQNNTFLDSSTNNFTITRNGNTTQGTYSPYGSNWSNYFNGASYFTSSASQIVPTGSFTVECWVYVTSTSAQSFVAQGTSGNAARFCLAIDGGLWFTQIGSVNINTGTPATNTWNYIAVTFNGTTLTLYVNGTSVGTASTTTSAQNTTLAIGTLGASWATTGYFVTGYISNVRISNTVRTITTPTAPYTSDANTTFLFCASNRFVDLSSNAYAMTLSAGSPSVQRFSPFSPTSAYSTSVIGGSGYFDGTGDYLTTPSNAAFDLSSGNWTIELWVYLTASYDSYYGGFLFGGAEPNTGGGGWSMVLRSGSIVLLGNGNSQGSYAVNFQLNTWNHIALVRSGTGASSVSLYFNGVPYTATGNGAGNPTFGSSNGPVYVGEHPSYTVTAITGYISNARVVKGTAVYAINQSSITVPTAPFTAITNTSLLLSGTNAGILDNAMMNDLETVGNAQISTSVKKYGTGSISFDGTDDRLVTAANPSVSFGTGDFTVEAWIYPNTLSGERGFIQTSDTAGGLKTSYTTGIVILIDVSPYRLVANVGGTNVNSGSTYISATTWTHVAITRASGSVRMFINGTLVGGPTTITTDLTGQNIVIGGYYSTTYLWNGYLDDVRITKGYARYTSSFTAPTAAFPNN